MTERVIHKFPLKRQGHQVIKVTGLLNVLDVQVQRDELVMWCARLEPSEEVTCIGVQLVGTGHPIPENVSGRRYFRTVQDISGLVWHVFTTTTEAPDARD